MQRLSTTDLHLSNNNYVTTTCTHTTSKSGHRHKNHSTTSRNPRQNHDLLPLSTSLQLKNKKRLVFFPIEFGELTTDGLIDTSALTSDFSEADSEKIQLLAPRSFLKEGPSPEFQIMVANGHLKTPCATAELQFEVGDIQFKKCFIVMTNLTSLLSGLLSFQRNGTISDIRQGVVSFLFFSMQLKHAVNPYSNIRKP